MDPNPQLIACNSVLTLGARLRGGPYKTVVRVKMDLHVRVYEGAVPIIRCVIDRYRAWFWHSGRFDFLRHGIIPLADIGERHGR